MEMEPDIYIRHARDGLSYWACLKSEVDVYDESTICDCGANVLLKPQVGRDKSDPLSSAAASVGSRIYEFGGFDFFSQRETDQVSYIDTNSPEQGWKLCQNSMLRPLSSSYAFTYNDDKVVLVGGKGNGVRFDPYFIQLYDPYTDEWVALPDDRSKTGREDPPYELSGHAVVDRGDGKRLIITHSSSTPVLYSFDVDKNIWDVHWGDDFGYQKDSSALVDGIYYVNDTTEFAVDNNLYLSGYDITLEFPKRLPVEILPKKCGKMDFEGWIPSKDYDDCMESSELFSLGNGKLAMVWIYGCSANSSIEMSTVHCCKFKMIREVGPDGGLKLLAQPLSKVSYHLEGMWIDKYLLVDPTKNMNFAAANLSTNKKRRIEEEIKT